MAYVTPPTAVTGVVWTAADMNIYRDDIIQLSTALLVPQHRTAEYYTAVGIRAADGTVALDNLFAIPIAIPATGTYDRIGLNNTATPTGNIRFGIYSDNGGQPGALLLDAGAMAVGAGVNEKTITQAIPGPSIVWLACVMSSGASAWSRYSGVGVTGSYTPGSSAPGGHGIGTLRAFTYGALPNPYGTVGTMVYQNQPSLFVRKA